MGGVLYSELLARSLSARCLDYTKLRAGSSKYDNPPPSTLYLSHKPLHNSNHTIENASPVRAKLSGHRTPLKNKKLVRQMIHHHIYLMLLIISNSKSVNFITANLGCRINPIFSKAFIDFIFSNAIGFSKLSMGSKVTETHLVSAVVLS